MLDMISRHAGTINRERRRCRNLHRNILAELLIPTGKLNEDADLTAHVDVRCHTACTLIAGEAAKGNLLPDRCRCLGNEGGNILAIQRACIQCIEICRVRLCNVLCDLRTELTELFIAGSKVRLAVDLDNDTDLRVGRKICCHRALSSDASRLLLGLCNPLLAQIDDCLLHIAVRLCKSLLAVHHTCARALTQFLYHRCTNCHYRSSYDRSIKKG